MGGVVARVGHHMWCWGRDADVKQQPGYWDF
jgi:hypothetical protein